MSGTATPGPFPSAGQSFEPTGTIGPAPSGWLTDWPAFPEIAPLDPDQDLAGGPLPEPSILEPFSIGEALYDPARMPEAVVSLLDMMGVGIYTADGALIRQGDERKVDDLWLTEDEVRGMIEMGIADASAADEDGNLPYRFADLAAGLAPLLPNWSSVRLAGAYDAAYRARPDDLVPLVMLGQPIEPDTTLTRVQIWLLLVDGFLTPAASTAVVPGALVAAGGPTWGTANAQLPLILSPSTQYTNAQFNQILAHIQTLAWTIPFVVLPKSTRVHEGHGGLGPLVNLVAEFGGQTSVPRSAFGALALPIRQGPPTPVVMNWTFDNLALLDGHGTLSPPGSRSPWSSSVGYQVRKEPQNNRGTVVSDSSTVRVSVPVHDLVSAVFDLPAGVGGMFLGDRQALGTIRVAWHAKEGIELWLLNDFNARLTGFNFGFENDAHAIGGDAMRAFLEKATDGSYRGYADAVATGTLDGTFGGETAHCDHGGLQRLFVVGIPEPRASGAALLHLSFYPASSPSFTEYSDTCPGLPGTWRLTFDGGGPYTPSASAQRDMRSDGYLPFWNARWNSPGQGLIIRLPTRTDPRVFDTVDDSSSLGLNLWYYGAHYDSGTGP